jgi:hypothetical protein
MSLTVMVEFGYGYLCMKEVKLPKKVIHYLGTVRFSNKYIM